MNAPNVITEVRDDDAHRWVVTNHKNALKTDNSLRNLEYVSQRENCQHAARLGLLRPYFKPGEQNLNAKLTEEQVRQIRLLRAQKVKAVDVAALFGVVPQSVYRIEKRQQWKHVV